MLNVEVDRDLARLFLEKAEEYNMKLFFGLYDSGSLWTSGFWKEEVEINLRFIDEVWDRYARYESFYGWYFVQEVGRNELDIAEIYNALGERCKQYAPDKPILISPMFYSKKVAPQEHLTPEQHLDQWHELLSMFKYVDIVAYQDGTAPTHELPEYWKATKEAFSRHNKIRLWCNCETFTRDMPIKYPSIDIRDLIAKLKAAEPYVDKAVTFEFSHFMSPNSTHLSARNLCKRYRELVEKNKSP